jgi:hypothetical protein
MLFKAKTINENHIQEQFLDMDMKKGQSNESKKVGSEALLKSEEGRSGRGHTRTLWPLLKRERIQITILTIVIKMTTLKIKVGIHILSCITLTVKKRLRRRIF